MSDLTSISDPQGSLRGSDPRSSSRKSLSDIGKVFLGAVAVILIAFAFAFWFFSAAAPRQVEMTLGEGDSLAKIVGYPASIEIAEGNNLQITGKLINPILTPAQARAVEPATDFVRVSVKVMPGAKVSMTVDEDGNRVPDTPIIYTPAPR